MESVPWIAAESGSFCSWYFQVWTFGFVEASERLMDTKPGWDGRPLHPGTTDTWTSFQLEGVEEQVWNLFEAIWNFNLEFFLQTMGMTGYPKVWALVLIFLLPIPATKG